MTEHMENNSEKEIYEFLKNVKKPVQFIDSRIDADALCSAIAMYHVLKNHFGVELTLCHEKNISPRYLEQLDGFVEVPEIKQNINPSQYDFSQHDCLICTDSGNLAHLSGASDFVRPTNIKILNIDHHSGNPGFGDYNYVKILGAACSVIYELLKKWQIQPEKQVANVLLMGIMLDTGFYTYNTTTALDFDHSAELIEFGAEHYKLTWRLTFNENEADAKLKKLVFNNLVIDNKQRLAYTTISLQELKDLDLRMEDSFVSPTDLIKKLHNIDFAFTVKELDIADHEYNISLRAHHEAFNCIAFAKMLNPNSGGHIMAAGANIKAQSMEEAVEIVIATTSKFRSQENS